MGRQVEFYMLPDDEREFVTYVQNDTEALIISRLNLENTPAVLDLLGEELPAWHSQVFLWRPGYPLFTDYRIMKAGPFEGRGVYFVNRFDSPVIEFSRSLFPPGSTRLSRGRIWADMYRLEGGQLVHKGEEFEKWYDTIAAWIRRRYRKIGTKPYTYMGPRAYKWYLAGGELQP
jgi:hypothetical protein